MKTNRIQSEQPTLSDQRPVIGALAAMAGMFGSLPAGHISVYRDRPDLLGLVLDHTADLEAWRAALGFSPVSVELHAHKGAVWLSMGGMFLGAQVRVHMHQVPVSFEAASVSPRDAEAAELALAGLPSEWSAAVPA